MRSLPALALILAALVALQGCAGAAYVDGRREAGKRITVGASNEDVVAICHSGSGPSAEAQKMADSECGKTGRTAQAETRVRFACSVQAPTRSYFRCLGPRKEVP